jgi:hypothetical protein
MHAARHVECGFIFWKNKTCAERDFIFWKNKTCAELATCSTMHKHVRACPIMAVKWPWIILFRWRFAKTHYKPVGAWKIHMLLRCMYKQNEIFLSGM